MNTIFLFNTSIAPTPGLRYDLRTCTAADARLLLKGADLMRTPIVSAIGHEATAQAMSSLLGRKVEVNRIPAQMVEGDSAIILKVKGRLEEGRILSLEDLELQGYDLMILEARPIPTQDDIDLLRWHPALLAMPDWLGAPEDQPRNTRRPVDGPACFVLRGDGDTFFFSELDMGRQGQVFRRMDPGEHLLFPTTGQHPLRALVGRWDAIIERRTFTGQAGNVLETCRDGLARQIGLPERVSVKPLGSIVSEAIGNRGKVVEMHGVDFDGSGRHGAGFDDPLTRAQKADE